MEMMMSEININQVDLEYEDIDKNFDGKNIYNKDKFKGLGFRCFEVGVRG